MRMRRPGPLPDGLTTAPFDRTAAKDAGVTSGRLRSRDLLRPYRGVQALSAPTTTWERCHAYAVRMRSSDSFSHVTAALLHGLPVPGALARRSAIDVTAVHPAAAPDVRGVIGHRLRAAPPVVLLRGLAVCEPVEAWCQLAGTLEVADLVAVADHLLATAEDEGTMRERLVAAIRSPGRYRTATLKQSVRLARSGSRSPQESRLRVHLVLGGIPEPALNAEVRAASWRVLGHGDLVWEDERVVGEYEGRQHRLDDEQWAYDIRRYDEFAAAGWTVVRVLSESLRPAARQRLIERFARALSLR